MTRQTIMRMVAGVLLLAGLVFASGCEYRDPCLDLPAPTAAELTAARAGATVEREVRQGSTTIECDLVDSGWQAERDR